MKINRDAMRDKIRGKLDEKYREDLNLVMQTPEGRRLFSYLLMDCGIRESMPQGNSKDIFNAGRRAVAVALTFACDSIDRPIRMSGMNLRHKAEQEYTELQLAYRDEILIEAEQKEKASMALQNRISRGGGRK